MEIAGGGISPSSDIITFSGLLGYSNPYLDYNGTRYTYTSLGTDNGYIEIPELNFKIRYTGGGSWWITSKYRGACVINNSSTVFFFENTQSSVVSSGSSSRVMIELYTMEAKLPVIYDHGSWSVPYDDVNYLHDGTTSTVRASIYSNYVHQAGGSISCLIGTANKINVTNYNTIKIIAKVSGPNQGLFLLTQKNDANAYRVGYVTYTDNSQYTEYTIDVSNITGEYYIASGCWNNRTVDFVKIWMTK